MRRSSFTTMLLSLLLGACLLLGLGSALSAQPYGGHRGGGRGGDHGRREGHGEQGNLGDQLTEDQRAALHSTTLQMWQEGASRDEIRDAVKALLEGWGIERPEHDRADHGPGESGPGHGRGGRFLRVLSGQLSEDQKEELHQLIGELRGQDASPDEIRAAVEEKLSGWSIELPEPPPELTQEQRQTLRAVIFELWTSGATREEIRSAAAQQLEDFGIQMPEHGPGPFKHGPRQGAHGRTPLPNIHDCLKPPLTREQRETVHETIKGLRKEGASPEEIHQVIRTLMEGFGIDIPDLETELTGEQRSTLRNAVLDLWLAGATREDICQEVCDLLEEFGFELPEESGELPSAGTSEMAAIQAQNYPNPANPETQINYTLGVSEDVNIQVYNISGQLVRTYDVGYQEPGSYSLRWDGRHQNGQLVTSGVYFYRIQAGPHSVTNRIVLLK